MLIRAISLSDVVFLINDHWEVPLGLHLGQVFPLGISRFEVPIGVAPGQRSLWDSQSTGFPLGWLQVKASGAPWPLGTPKASGLWAPLGLWPFEPAMVLPW